jgi:hypothetical protein
MSNSTKYEIRATEKFIRFIAEWLVDNYDLYDDLADDMTEDSLIEERINRITSNPTDVGIVFTSCMETDTDTWEEFGDEHDIQFSYDLCAMTWKLYLDNVLIHEEALDEHKWGYLYGMGYDEMCGDLFDLCGQYAPLPDEHEYC